ncbi:MAG: 30S ribosomal protein S8 [Candidatus Micrarchaeia archaeon]|jgi:small subunit ribosomal protein S8
MNVFDNAINAIKVNEMVGKDECIIPSTKLIKAVLEVLKANKYILDYEEFKDNKIPKLRVKLAKAINNIGVIKPRFPVRLEEFNKYETRYIPSKDFGILIVSTSKGVMTNKEAKEKHLGGRLLAYVY